MWIREFHRVFLKVMATSVNSDDGFVKVTRKKGKGRKISPKKTTISENYGSDSLSISNESCLRRINESRSEMNESAFLKDACYCISEALERLHGGNAGAQGSSLLNQLVCYGLGNFSSCIIARYQLALLLCLREHWQIPPGKIWVYDPLFSLNEKDILEDAKLSVVEYNEEGCRQVTSLCIFYMPHCGKALYNNLLWENWSLAQLQHLVIIGNSFSAMRERLPEKEFLQEYYYIAKILPFCTEAPLPNTFEHKDIFNDTAVHIFTTEKLRDAPADIWKWRDKPVYSHETEFIRAEVA